jgi:Cdc6-like AAA superfamily ATPase
MQVPPIKLPHTQEDWRTLDFEIMQLFSPATPINEADLFAGRRPQVIRLIEAVSERGRHAVLYGERGVGKTSLASIFHMLIGGPRRTVIPIRKQAGPTDTFVTLWKRVFEDIQVEKIDEAGNPALVSLADQYLGAITPDNIVKELANFSINHVPVIIIDEFDKLKNSRARQLISHTIKSLSDAGINATIVIVGVADDIDFLISEHSSVERNLTEIKMPRMSNDEMNQILDTRIPKVGMKLHSDARWKIVTLSRGLPTYVHQLGRDAARRAVERKKLTILEEDVDEAIKILVQQSDQTTNKAYNHAIHSNKKNNLYKQVLLASAICNTDDDGKFTPSNVVEPLSNILGRSVRIANFLGHLNAFCETDRGPILEKRGARGAFRYRFREPKMQPYVIMRGIADGGLSEGGLSILSAPAQPRLSTDF